MHFQGPSNVKHVYNFILGWCNLIPEAFFKKYLRLTLQASLCVQFKHNPHGCIHYSVKASLYADMSV